jgi:hypothetical protein
VGQNWKTKSGDEKEAYVGVGEEGYGDFLKLGLHALAVAAPGRRERDEDVLAGVLEHVLFSGSVQQTLPGSWRTMTRSSKLWESSTV